MELKSGNGSGNNEETFQEFYEKWKDEQKKYLDDLITASINSQQPQTNPLPDLVERVVAHYEKYYSIKTEWAKTDVLRLLSTPWNSLLEDAYLWVGGWRPTTAFHLLYSKSSLQFEARLSDYLNGEEIGDLGDISQEQVSLIDNLQKATVKEERDITEKLAKQQGKVADMEMVELSHKGEGESNKSRVNSVLKTKVEGFVMILKKADDLRLKTLKDIVGILSAIQAVHFLIAAAQLLMRLHDWGKEEENEETEASTRAVS